MLSTTRIIEINHEMRRKRLRLWHNERTKVNEFFDKADWIIRKNVRNSCFTLYVVYGTFV